MNQQAGNITGMARPPRRQDYEDIVRAQFFSRRLSDEEMELRSSLLLMRDQAISTKARASFAAFALLDLVAQVAGEEALNRLIPTDELRQVRRFCVMTVLAARGFDQIYQPHLPGIEQGEANARG